MSFKFIIPVQTAVDPFDPAPLLIQTLPFFAVARYRCKDPPVFLTFDPEDPMVLYLRRKSISQALRPFVISFIRHFLLLSLLIHIPHSPPVIIDQAAVPVLMRFFPVFPLVADVYDRADPFPFQTVYDLCAVIPFVPQKIPAFPMSRPRSDAAGTQTISHSLQPFPHFFPWLYRFSGTSLRHVLPVCPPFSSC